MATFWVSAAHSVDHMFPMYFDYLLLLNLVISRLGFEGGVLDLIAPDFGHYILVTFEIARHYCCL